MYAALSPGAIGVTAPDLDSAIVAAKEGEFKGVEVNGAEIADLVEATNLEAVRDKFATAGILPAAFGLSVKWQGSQEELSATLPELDRIAKACTAIGCVRCCTFIMPCSNDRDYAANRKFHIERLAQAARVLANHGCALGLEFIGPKTLRDTQRYPFIYQIGPMMEMANEIGPNTGLLLDAWHWYTSGGSVEDIARLEAKDVVYVHVNDAPPAIDRDAQVDNKRCLPASTGVIDSQGFMRALQKIGYDGPVTPEPFSQELDDLPSDKDRLRVVADSMDKLFSYLFK